MAYGTAKFRTRRGFRSRRSSVQILPGQWCLSLVDAGFVGILFFAPLLFGGRHDLGRFVFVALAGMTATAWFGYQALSRRPRWRRTPTLGIAAGAVLLVALQLVPLPSAILARLSPHLDATLPLWTSAAESSVPLGPWRTISLTPSDTRIALAMCLAYALLFTTAVQRISRVGDAEKLLRAIAASAVFLACVALLHTFLGNGLYYWFYEIANRPSDTAPCSPFTNRNHLAHYLALGVAPLIAWLVASWQHLKAQPHENAGRRSRPESLRRRSHKHSALAHQNALRVVLALAAAVLVFTALLTLSRGGAVAMAVAVIVFSGGCYRSGLFGGRSLLAVAGVGCSVVGLLSLYGYDHVAERLGDAATGSLSDLDQAGGRRAIWAANLAAFADSWRTGSGAGSHAEIYPLYIENAPTVEFTHAENGYLQIATENGMGGVLLLCLAVGCLAVAAWRIMTSSAEPRMIIAGAAAAAGLTASVVHSLFDFVWYIPACCATTLLLAACVIRLSQLASDSSRSVALPPSTRIAMAVGAALAACWATAMLIGPGRASVHWDAYQRMSAARSAEVHSLLRASQPEQRLAAEENCRRLDVSMIGELNRALRCSPRHGRANLRLGKLYLRRFETLQRQADNVMSATEVRDAALASQFTSRRQLLAWLRAAFGKNADLLLRAHWHTRRALALCPLEGDAYLQLAELIFLEGRKPAAIDDLVDQAVAVRPSDGDILFEAGIRRLTQGRPEEAEALWKTAFRLPGMHRLRLIQYVGSSVAADVFLEMFQPDWTTLNDIWRTYRVNNARADLDAIADHGQTAAVQAEASADPWAATNWLWLSKMYAQLGRDDEALASTSRAMRLAPHRYVARRSHAFALHAAGRHGAAEQHFRWCLARRPDDEAVQQTLKTMLRLAPSIADRSEHDRSTLPAH